MDLCGCMPLYDQCLRSSIYYLPLVRSLQGVSFIRSEEDDMNHSWEQKLVKRYYDKLFKEYCIADMSQYKSGKIGLRWRTEKEVISGKGQFICGNKHCNEKDGLASYEVNFSYFEAGENKQALVKVVTCERCAEKLHYKKRKEKEKEKEKEFDRKQKKDYKRKRDQSKDKDDTDEERERSREKRKGKRASSSAINHESDDGDEDFDKYLEGMFP
ncbi:uncharacterized protein LOC108467465 isoform X3 [Gossypium arboreum]|uniref:uncharacterized protein LOC108467465 isoform X3 n=1 Tax=Gossypium arboreum TaxID=29729 RepID=UPI000818F691|nr:uncharacterized protein LOC108467465 isoform X3 [Gossypium arboreum]